MLRQGSISRASVGDPQGRNPKIRPLVIVTPTQEITSAAPIVAVAITGVLHDPLEAYEVALLFHPGGEAHSGLTKH